jgi:predicted small metal-binding protein
LWSAWRPADVARAWRCLEAGCDALITAENDEELLAAANQHVGEVHGSFELDDVILDAAEDAPVE